MGEYTWTLELEIRCSMGDMIDAIGGNETAKSNS
jgi:hypothetical protein